jgi:hypothetical protein
VHGDIALALTYLGDGKTVPIGWFAMLMKIAGSVRRRGPLGCARRAWSLAWERADLSGRMWRRKRRAIEAAFDRDRGVDTGGEVELDGLQLRGQPRWKGHKYQGVIPEWIREAIRDLNVHYPSYTFIDMGSGKGRSLLIAAEFPFRQVLGVELAKELHQIAERNIRFDRHADRRRCRDVTSIWADATEHPLPDGDLVIFLHNPFPRQEVERLLENIGVARAAAPRDIRIIFIGSSFDHAPLQQGGPIELNRRPTVLDVVVAIYRYGS